MIGLLLDLDGTIADTFPVLFQAFRHAVSPWVRRSPTDAEIIATFGPAEQKCIERLLSHPELVGGIGEMPVPPPILAAAVERYHARYESAAGEFRLFPGFAEVFDAADARGYKVGVFTGKCRRSAEFTLDALGLLPRLNALVTSDDATRPKPDPEGVRLALARMGLTPGESLVVGDSPADVGAGTAAGTRTGAALWGAFDRAATAAAGATWNLESPSDLTTIIEHFPRAAEGAKTGALTLHVVVPDIDQSPP